MKTPKTICERGFSLLELMIAIALALVITIAGVMALTKVEDLSTIIAQRSDMQENARSAFNYLSTDIGLAGIGMPAGGTALPIVTINQPNYGSIFSACCIAFVNDVNNHPFLYSAEGGWSSTSLTSTSHLGADFKPVPLITVSYVDTAVSSAGGQSTTCGASPAVAPMVLDWFWPLPTPPNPAGSTHSAEISDIPQGTQIRFDPCTNITNPADPSNALKIGDALLVCDGTCAVGIITDLPGDNSVLLKSGDPLNINQPNATTGNIQAMKAAGGGSYPPGATAVRINIVTYYLDPDAGRDGIKGTSDDGPPFRLMRRINAGNPVVLAENILDLQVSYDQYDDSNTSSYKAGVKYPSVMTPGMTPGLFRNVNLWITVRSPMPNSRGAYQGMSLATSVAPRNLSYSNRYQ